MDNQKNYIGKIIINDDSTQVSEDTETICRSQLPQGTRVLKKDSVVTMDYIEGRLNLKIDDDNRVIQQYYG